MTALRARRLPAPAVLLIGTVGILAIDVFRGGQAKIPSLMVLGLVVSIAAVSFVADWRRVVTTLVLVVLLIPNDGRYTLPAGLPFQLEPYRLIVGLFLIGWVASLLVDRRVRFRATKFEGPLMLMLLAVLGSEVVNPGRVSVVESFVIKSLWLYICFVLIVYMVVSVLRTRDALDRVIVAMVCAGCVVAIAAIIQMKTGMNIFDYLRLVLPLDYTAVDETVLRGGHFRALASAGHPIELSSTLSMLMPFAIYLAIKQRKRVWWFAFLLLMLGEFASGSRTGMLGVAAMVGVFLWLRPRQTIRFWPALLPLLVVVHFVAPGALGGVYSGFFPSGGLVAQQSQTFHGRQLSRLSRVGTSLHEFSHYNPLFGQGWGTRVTGGEGNFDASNIQTNPVLPSTASLAMSTGQLYNGVNAEILDDQWLKTLLEAGILGVLSWLWLLFRAIRRLGARAKAEKDSADGWLPVALAASLLGFMISMGTYDAFSFVQATTMAFVLIAFSSVVLQMRPATADGAATAGAGDPHSHHRFAVAAARRRYLAGEVRERLLRPERRLDTSRVRLSRASRFVEGGHGASHSPSRPPGDSGPQGEATPLDLRRVIAGRSGERQYRAIGPRHPGESDAEPGEDA